MESRKIKPLGKDKRMKTIKMGTHRAIICDGATKTEFKAFIERDVTEVSRFFSEFSLLAHYDINEKLDNNEKIEKINFRDYMYQLVDSSAMQRNS